MENKLYGSLFLESTQVHRRLRGLCEFSVSQILQNQTSISKVGPTQPRVLTQPCLFGNYVPRPHHESAACINLKSRARNLLIQRQTREPLRHLTKHVQNTEKNVFDSMKKRGRKKNQKMSESFSPFFHGNFSAKFSQVPTRGPLNG